MAINLREQAESDLAITLEGEFGLPVELTNPDTGAIQTVQGQVLYDTVSADPETGAPIISNNPVVTLRRSSLNPVPQPGERWHVRIPITPSRTAALDDFMIDDTHPPDGGASLGTIRLHLIRAEQL